MTVSQSPDIAAPAAEAAPQVQPAAGGDGPVYASLMAGDPFPWMIQACGAKAQFGFDTFAGRYQLYGFFGSAEDPQTQAALRAVQARESLFDDRHCSFFGVSASPRDRDVLGMTNQPQGVRFAWDFDRSMARACGVAPISGGSEAGTAYWRKWILVDPTLHVLQVFPFRAETVHAVLDAVAALPPPARFGGAPLPAPILMLPNVFEPAFCQALIGLYEAAGGRESGVHRDGQGVLDGGFKRRKDHALSDPAMIAQTNARISRRVLPEIEKVFFMKCRFIERHIVGCYSAQDGGHFGPHRDNREGLTAHRRFAISINLSDDFEGGEVAFPEYSLQGYKARAGWAVVFPCAVLHQVNPVRRGTRYAFLPFVYDQGGREIRDAGLARSSEAGAEP